MKTRTIRLLFILAVFQSLAVMAAKAETKDSVAQFYHGKNLLLIVGSVAGGGYDVYARLLARHFDRHVPGHPAMIVQNMMGASSLTMTNHLYNSAARDGTVIGASNRDVFLEPLFGNASTRFEPLKFGWIGSMNQDVLTCYAWHTSGVSSLADVRKKALVMGTTSATSKLRLQQVGDAIGVRFNVISGYKGSNDIGLAMERGEVEGTCTGSLASLKSAHKDWMDGKLINIFLQLAIKSHPDLLNIPLVTDIALSDDDRQAMELIFAAGSWGRPITAPPEVPEDRLRALRSAFDLTMQDPLFLAEAKKSDIEILPLSGKTIEELLRRVLDTPKRIVDKVAARTPG